MAVAHIDAILHKCASFSHIKQFQSHLTTTGLLHAFPSIRVKLVELCAISSFGSLDHSLIIFKHIPFPTTNDWNAVIRGLSYGPNPHHAIPKYLQMMACDRRPDALTCSFVLKACARVSTIVESYQIHSQVLRFGYFADVMLGTTLVDVYAKSGELGDAEKVFEEMEIRDIATWNALICGFATGSRPYDAIGLFRRLRESEDVRGRPNDVTVVGALSACAQLGTVADGEAVREYAWEKGLGRNPRVCNALIDMYAKCGSVDKAIEV